jgi:hypothetical protein
MDLTELYAEIRDDLQYLLDSAATYGDWEMYEEIVVLSDRYEGMETEHHQELSQRR